MSIQFSYESRVQLEALCKQKKSRSEMAAFFGCSVRTIFYELKRGQVEQLDGHSWQTYFVYDAAAAQRRHDAAQSSKGKQVKLGNSWDFVSYAEQKIVHEKYSSRALLAEMQREGKNFGFSVSHATLYSWIDKGYLGIKYSQLPEGHHNMKKKHFAMPNYSHALDKSITKRPASVAGRKEFGHWEMDTVVGKRKGKKQVLLVLTERKTKMQFVEKMKNKTVVSTVRTLDRLRRFYGDIFKTITVDNGCEFADPAGIEKAAKTQVFYCHPYSSWERGQNENANRMIRRFVPKGSDINGYTKAQIEHVQRWMNCYPRKALNWQRPIDLFKKELKLLNISIPVCANY